MAAAAVVSDIPMKVPAVVALGPTVATSVDMAEVVSKKAVMRKDVVEVAVT